MNATTRPAPAPVRAHAASPWACAVALGLALALTLACLAPARAQAPATWVTVVVEVALSPGSEPAEALAALNDMRSLMKQQPGYVSELVLQNLNPANPPRWVHVSCWASMDYWAALFRAPAFAALSAHGNDHYRITASAFLPMDPFRGSLSTSVTVCR